MDDSNPYQRRRLSESQYSLLRSFSLIQTNSVSTKTSSTKDCSKPSQELVLRRRSSVDAPPRLPGLGERTRLRRVLTSEIPLLDLPFVTKPSGNVLDVSNNHEACRNSPSPNTSRPTREGNGFRGDYMLGDPARSIRHMKIEDTRQSAFDEVSKLKTYDFAFVKRSDESWTYAICAARFQEDGKECMLFVLNKGGATKHLNMQQWADSIRVVAPQTDEDKVPKHIFFNDNMSDDCSAYSYGSC